MNRQEDERREGAEYAVREISRLIAERRFPWAKNPPSAEEIAAELRKAAGLQEDRESHEQR